MDIIIKRLEKTMAGIQDEKKTAMAEMEKEKEAKKSIQLDYVHLVTLYIYITYIKQTILCWKNKNLWGYFLIHSKIAALKF